MSQYLLSIYQPDGPPPPPETLAEIMKNMAALVADLKAAGAHVMNAGLQPPLTASVVRITDGDLLSTDGPYIESKEHLGGFLVIDVPDLATARTWAGRLARVLVPPGASSGLGVEIRPVAG